MRRLFVSLIAASLAGSSLAGAPARSLEPQDQDAALAGREAGELLGLDALRSNVSRQLGGKFLGCDCDPHSARYRMKYLRDGKVLMVDVDARTGDILRIDE